MKVDRLHGYLRELKGHPGFGGMAPLTVLSANSLGDTPLHVAVRRGDTEVVGDMLDAGADINAKGEEGDTPLHYAVMWDNTAMVHLLLERGACIQTLNSWGKTPSDTASRRGVAQIIEAIQSYVA